METSGSEGRGRGTAGSCDRSTTPSVDARVRLLLDLSLQHLHGDERAGR